MPTIPDSVTGDDCDHNVDADLGEKDLSLTDCLLARKIFHYIQLSIYGKDILP